METIRASSSATRRLPSVFRCGDECYVRQPARAHAPPHPDRLPPGRRDGPDRDVLDKPTSGRVRARRTA